MAILLIGAVGGPNFGDELILRSWLQEFLSRGWKPCDIYVDGYNQTNVSEWLSTICSGVSCLEKNLSLWSNRAKFSKSDLEKENWLHVIGRFLGDKDFLNFIIGLAGWVSLKK